MDHRFRCGWDSPVPIPNMEIKPPQHDGSARASVWESRTLPRLNLKAQRKLGAFFFLGFDCDIFERDKLYQSEDANMSGKEVQCVPGGHQISLDKAYWCNHCEHYLCYSHARTTITVNTVKCPKGHEVTKVR
jgi:hypothetical protein